MSCPKVVRIVTPGPPGPGLTVTGPVVAGRASGTGGLVPIPLGPGLSIVDGALTVASTGTGTVTSVGLTVPTGFSIANSPITNSGTLAISFALGYSLPTTAKQGQWDQAYADLGQARTPTVHGHAIADVTGLQTALGAKADLVSGLVPASQLPSFVDDVLEYASFTAFPVAGEPGKLYVSLATGRVYRWAGSAYIEIISSPGSTDSIAEGSVNLFFTDARGQASAATWWAGSAAKTKLDGIASGATANSTDAQLRDRATHTGTQPATTITGLSTVATSGVYNDLSGKPDLSVKADLVNGLVPSSQLPGFVDDVLEFANLAAFPATGEAGKLYIALNTNKQYRWAGSTYQEINPSPGSTDAIPEGSVNLYHTTLRAAAAAPVQSVAGKTGTVTLAKGDVGLGNADNTSDADKPVSTATATALGGKAGTGAIGSSGLTMATARLLGRTTAGAGAIEEIQVAGGTFADGILTLSSLPSSLTANANGNLTFTARWIQSTNGAASAPAHALTGTWFTGGTTTTTKPLFLIEPAGTPSNNWITSGTALGVNAPSTFFGRMIDLQVNGTSQFSVESVSGAWTVKGQYFEVASNNYYAWTFRSFLSSPSAGVIRLSDWAGSGFDRLQFGGTNSSFPSIKRSSAKLQVRLADDSGFADIDARAATFSGNVTVSAVNIVTDDAVGTKFGTATTQKLSFWNATPVAQLPAVADATDNASAITAVNLLAARLRTIGIIAT